MAVTAGDRNTRLVPLAGNGCALHPASHVEDPVQPPVVTTKLNTIAIRPRTIHFSYLTFLPFWAIVYDYPNAT